MSLRNTKVTILAILVLALTGVGSAQWKVLHPRIIEPNQLHFVDSSTVLAFYGGMSYQWRSAHRVLGVSRNGGQIWTYTILPIPQSDWQYQDVSFFSQREGYLLAAADSHPWSTARDLYHTTDGGGTWTPHRTIPFTALEWQFISAREGIVSSGWDSLRDISEPYITHDSGTTFHRWTTPHGRIIPFAENGPYLVIADTVAWVSFDSGRTFSVFSYPVRSNYYGYCALPDGHVWTFSKDTSKKSSPPVVLQSSDYGKNWRAYPFPTMDSPNSIHFRDSVNGIAITDTELRTSSDGGRSWTPATTRFGSYERMSYDIPSGHVLFMEGAYPWPSGVTDLPFWIRRSTDFGRTWTTIPNTLLWQVRDIKRLSPRDLVALSLATHSISDWKYPVDSVAVMVSRDDGTSWTETILKPGPYQEQLTVFPGGGVLLGATMFSEDYGQTWSHAEFPQGLVATAIPAFTTEGVGWTAAKVDSQHVVVLESMDRGRSWRSRAQLTLPIPGGGFARRILALPSGGILLSCFVRPQIVSPVMFHAISMDRGQTWGSFRATAPTNWGRTEPATRDGKHFLYCETSSSEWLLYRSSDSGVTYSTTRLQYRFPPPKGMSLSSTLNEIGWISDSVCYAMDASGYFLSRDGGQTWTPEEGHLLASIRQLVIGDSLEQWFVGMHGLILQHHGPLGIVTSTDSPSPAPRDFSLPVTYPNPASSSSPAQVAFTLERDMSVGVFVYDLLGRRQRVLHEGRLPAGPQRFTLSTTGLSPGLYFVTVSTPEGVRVGKVVVGR